MSRLGALLITLVALPGAAPAQDARAWRDSTLHVAGLLRAMRDSIATEEARLAEVARLSRMVMTASPDAGAASPGLLQRFDQERRQWFGTTFPSPQGFRIALNSATGRSVRRTAQETSSIVISGLPDSAVGSRVSSLMLAAGFLNDGDAVVREFLFHYGQMMLAGTGAVQRWLPVLPLMMSDPDRREQAMYALVTGVGPAQRGCILGDLADCAYALGLRPSNRADPGGQYLPLVRADLLLAAIDMGGTGAWDRLVRGSEARVETRLAAAAGAPIDSVISRWRRDVLALRPDRTPVRVMGVVSILGWSVLAVLAALGSARWV